MKATQEYNNAEVYFHGVTDWAYGKLLEAAGGKDEDIVLYGRIFNSEVSFRQAEADGDYEEEKGQGYVYACDFDSRENATPGAGAYTGPVLMLGWDGVGEDDVISKRGGEYLVPLSSYKVIGVVEEE